MSAVMTITPGSASLPEPFSRHPAGTARHARTAPRAGYRSDSVELEAIPAAVPAARARTRAMLRAWDLEDLAEDGESIVAELAGNAIEATIRAAVGGPVRLTLIADQRTLLIAVRDTAPGEPVLQDPGPDAPCGRGLLIVDALAAWWDCTPAPGGGKVIRAMVEASPVPDRPRALTK